MEIKCIFDFNVWVICICVITSLFQIGRTIENVAVILTQPKYFEKEKVETDEEEEV